MNSRTDADRFRLAHETQEASLDEQLNSDIVVAVRRLGDDDFVTLPTVDMAVGVTCWGHGPPEWTTMDLRIGAERWRLRARYEEPDSVEALEVEFEDGSALRLDDSARRRGEPLDTGFSLLLPVSPREMQGVERLLALLWDAAANDQLTEAQERKILSIAEMIGKQHRESEPGRTERWKVVGAIAVAFGYLLTEVPDGIVKWSDAWGILTSIDWHTVASALPGGG